MGALLACKSMHNEVVPLLYRHVEICLSLDNRAEIQFLRIDPKYRQHTKTITIDIDTQRPDWENSKRVPTSRERALWVSLCVQRAVDFLRLWESGGTNIHTVTFKAPWHSAECNTSECFDPNPKHVCLTLEPLFKDATIFSKIQNVAFVNLPFLHGSRLPGRGRCPRSRSLKQDQKSAIVTRLGLDVALNAPVGILTLVNRAAHARKPSRLSPALWEAQLHQHNEMLLEQGLFDEGSSSMLRSDNDVINRIDTYGMTWAKRDLPRKRQRILRNWDETVASTNDQALYTRMRDIPEQRKAMQNRTGPWRDPIHDNLGAVDIELRKILREEWLLKIMEAWKALDIEEEDIIANLCERIRTM